MATNMMPFAPSMIHSTVNAIRHHTTTWWRLQTELASCGRRMVKRSCRWMNLWAIRCFPLSVLGSCGISSSIGPTIYLGGCIPALGANKHQGALLLYYFGFLFFFFSFLFLFFFLFSLLFLSYGFICSYFGVYIYQKL